MSISNFYKNTVSTTLWNVLSQLMRIELLAPFRLVGGTALSLQLGHRMSVDIDLFTDVEYGSLDFYLIDKKLQEEFPFVEMQYAGNDSFIRPILEVENVRLGTIEEIAAMKMEVIGQAGRKKDYWDIHELLQYLSLDEMLALHGERYPYSHTMEGLKKKIVDFQYADLDFNPICLKGKFWELIKEDIQEKL